MASVCLEATAEAAFMAQVEWCKVAASGAADGALAHVGHILAQGGGPCDHILAQGGSPCHIRGERPAGNEGTLEAQVQIVGLAGAEVAAAAAPAGAVVEAPLLGVSSRDEHREALFGAEVSAVQSMSADEPQAFWRQFSEAAPAASLRVFWCCRSCCFADLYLFT